MPVYDVLTIAAIVDECDKLLIGARIQQVLHVDARTIAFEVYAGHRRRWLVMSIHPDDAGFWLSTKRIDADPERVSPLLLLLRKYARGGRIVAISQPPFERIIRLSIAKPTRATNRDDDIEDDNDDIDLTTTELYVELMGRRSNIILVDDEGRILDSIKRVSPEMSRVRTVRPRQMYIAPPPQNRIDPAQANAASLTGSEQPQTIERQLIATFHGMSPALAREAAYRAGLDATASMTTLDDSERQRLATAVRGLFEPLETGAFSAWTYQQTNGRSDFSSVELASLAASPDVEATPAASVLEAAEQIARSERPEAAPQRHAARRERLLEEIDQARARIDNRLRSLAEQAARAEEAELWRAMGEAIYIHVAEIVPRQEVLRTEDGLEIPLDPSLTASQNAQELFERYRKAQAAEHNVPQLMEAARQELAYVDQVRAMATLAEGFDDIEAVRLEWIEQGVVAARAPSRANRPRPSREARRPRTFRTRDGDTILVGRTGPQNDQVTFTIAAQGDLWLHVRNMPGAHVILRSHGPHHNRAIETAAALAAWYSDGRGSTAVEVDATEQRNVRKIKGAGPGMVTYRNERTINVRPASERELGLEPLT
ncbi:MAG TPA: NFACT RNA binding domain-containing protein [Thermomicrobiales bacterium]|nr:NFACT RNA binding domain-containing protein [Thermomicrobiales bacterium]HRA30337.1 NFACT RNA binding domain-containing protein [Thermomicrobiales bacterium]